MDGAEYKIYERDVRGGLRAINEYEDMVEAAVAYEKHKAVLNNETILMRSVADEEGEIIAVKKQETASLEYIEGLMKQAGLAKEDVKHLMTVVKMYKYKKCDEFRATAKLYAERYINLGDTKMNTLQSQLDLLPHPQD